MPLKVRFFASLAESVGRREAVCDYVEGMTPATVWRHFHPGDTLSPDILCAVNHEYGSAEQVLADRDEVAFFPPVTGG